MSDVQEKKAWHQKDWVILLIISSAYIAVFANIQGFKALLPLVQEEFQISRTQVGFYSSFYFLSAVLIAVFSGRIVDRLGTKKSLYLGAGVVGLMIILHALSPTFWLILIFAFFTGVAFSIITPAVNKGVLELAEPAKRSFFMGIVHGGGGFGGFLGAVLLPVLGGLVGWRSALLFGSVFAIAVALCIFKFYRPADVQVETVEKKAEKPPRSLKEDILHFLANRYLLSVFSMGIVFGLSISSVSGHFPLYLTQDLGFSPTFAGLGLGIFHIGGIIGQPFWGLVNEKVLHGDRRKGMFSLGLLIAALTLFFGAVVSRVSFSHVAVLFFAFLLGFCILGVIAIYFTTVSELVSREHIGVVTGVALIFPRASTVLAPPLFGLIADVRGAYAGSWIVLGAVVLLITLAFFYFSGKYASKKSALEG